MALRLRGGFNLTGTFELTAPAAPRARVRRGGWSWGPVEGAKLRVLSLGAGVQSTTLLLMVAHGELPEPDLVVFADTGAEPPKVYEHVRWLSLPQVQRLPIVAVTAGNIVEDLRRQAGGSPAGPGGRSPAAPFFTTGRKGHAAPLSRQCTGHYKIDPINRELRRRLGFRPRQRIPVASAEVWIGISTDEVVRAGAALEPWIVNRYPLLEARMSRIDCERWLTERGYPIPPKSACVFCPYRTDAEWRRLRDQDAEGWATAVEIDALVRGGIKRNDKGTSTGRLFAHRSLKPLDQVDLSTAEERGQGMLMVCEAGCGL